MKNWLAFIGLFLQLGIYTGCSVSYSFTGASIAPEIETINIQYFPNNAPLIEATLSQRFTESLKDKFSSQTDLSLVDNGGDLIMEGAITGYSIQPSAIQANETAALNKLTISVKVKFTNTVDESQSYESTFTESEEYGSSQDFSSVKESLIETINERLIEKIFNKAVVNW